MAWLAQGVARLIGAARQVSTRKWTFLALAAFVFLVTFSALGAAGLAPDSSAAVAAPSVSLTAAGAPVPSPIGPEAPMKVEIPSINLAVTVANPATADASVLDADLLAGAVRYPTSALLNQDGNVVIFGHSSYLPIVRNQAYKTFDGIQKLKSGDLITVSSASTAYTYAVATVTKENADQTIIPLSVAGRVLTLSTCDSFATKSDRFVVTARLVDSHPLQP